MTKKLSNAFAVALMLAGGLLQPCLAEGPGQAPLSPRPLPPDVTPRVNPAECGTFSGFYGPFDYRRAPPSERRKVEEHHLDMEMQTFLGGRVEGRNRAGISGVAGGFQYTLNSFPNHPAALKMMEELGRRLKSEQPQNTLYLECWYLRGFMLTPDDPVIRIMYGIYLAHRSRAPEAVLQLDQGEQRARSSANLQYHAALGYLAADEARKAQLAYMRARALGMQLDFVERDLKARGKWDANLAPEPDAGAEETAGAVAAAPSASAPR